jgi:hypothetical protein
VVCGLHCALLPTLGLGNKLTSCCDMALPLLLLLLLMMMSCCCCCVQACV